MNLHVVEKDDGFVSLHRTMHGLFHQTSTFAVPRPTARMELQLGDGCGSDGGQSIPALQPMVWCANPLLVEEDRFSSGHFPLQSSQAGPCHAVRSSSPKGIESLTENAREPAPFLAGAILRFHPFGSLQ